MGRQDKEKDDLRIEDLEKRVAPLLIYQKPEVEPDPGTTGGGGAGDGGGVGETEQPGNSDDRRNKPYKGGNA